MKQSIGIGAIVPKLLVIPDVHESVDKVNKILDKYPDVPKLWLGDFFDSFYLRDASTLRTCQLLNEILERGDPVCIGNHDSHYMFNNNVNLRCSGYSRERRDIIHANVDMEKWRRHALLFHVRGDYYLSHAGFHPSLIPKGLEPEERLSYLSKEALKAVDQVKKGQFPVFFQAGFSRGGTHKWGGPNWLDWSEFQEIPTMPQIVGHSQSREVRQKGESFCIDTSLRHVALLEDGKVSIERVIEE